MPPSTSNILIRSLQRPSAYRHNVADIELVETHISWVLLTGQFAYKIKKPVDLGFVDFTSLQRRRFFCEEELRLNRRLAPQLYLDVTPITGTPASPTVGGEGDAIEFAVRMRQFPQPALLSRVLERGELSAEQVDELAAEVADFHAAIEIAQADSPFGTPEAVRAPVLENFRHLDVDGRDHFQTPLPSRGEVVRGEERRGDAACGELSRAGTRRHGETEPASGRGGEEETHACSISPRSRQSAIRNPQSTIISTLPQPLPGRAGSLETDSNDAHRLEQLRRLRQWSDDEFAAHEHDFAARKRGGFVRECHGDMHLGNMILLDGRIVIFDCIEFNDSLRWIDVASEVAFCTMDLEDRGRPDLAHGFLNTYLELTGDYAALTVLPYYLVYRALVRAKVAGIRLSQPDLELNEKQRLLDRSHSYLDLAERYATRCRPMLAITHGFSGSGKTTGTTNLVADLGMIRLRSDVERKRLFGYGPSDRTKSGVDEGIYAADASRKTYDRLAELAQTALQAGFPTVVDATFLKRADRDRFRQIAKQLDVPFRILDFRVSEEILKKRIADRQREGRDASEATADVLSTQLATHEPLSSDELGNAIVIDGNKSSVTAEILRRQLS
ncbi:MAG: AAA family ATPase [Planctomycetaceae bacterium]